MRILHVIPYMHPRAGGPPVVVENLVRETIRLGHSTEIISTSLLCDGDASTVLRRLNELAPTTFVSRTRTLAPFDRSTRRRIEEAVRIADIIHLHTLWSPINAMVRRKCIHYRKPYVLMPHGMLDPYSLSVKRWRKAFYLWAVERKVIQSAQRMIYTTLEEERLAARQFWSLPKSVVIPLGGDGPGEHSAALASQFLARFPRARGRRQLLFLGRLHFKKGLDRILTVLPEIVREFPDVLLTIVGDGAAAFEGALKRTIESHDLGNNVLMTGRLDGAAKWGAYASAELFLLPSRQENFAITVAEAMHMGVPVLISSKVNTWPYVEAAAGGVVLDEATITSKLCGSLSSLLRDREALTLMGRRGQAYARKHLTWERAALELQSCYEDVIASKRSES